MFVILKNIYFWLIILVIILSQLKIKIAIFYIKKANNNELGIRLYIFKNFLPIKFELPAIKALKGFILPDLMLEEELEIANPEKLVKKDKKRISLDKINWQRVIEELKRLKRIIIVYRSIFTYFFCSLNCEYFSWITEYGAEDAANTGFNLGLIWWIKGATVAFFQSKIKFNRNSTHLHVIPQFSHPSFDVNLHCIFAMKLGHIIIVGIKVIGQYLKKG